MGIIIGFILVLFVVTCLLLPVIILLQDSKGEGLSSSAFGGGSMQSILGGRGAATFLSRLTTWLAIAFMVMSLFLMRFYGEAGRELKPLQQTATESGPTITTSEEAEESTSESETDAAEETETPKPEADQPVEGDTSGAVGK